MIRDCSSLLLIVCNQAALTVEKEKTIRILKIAPVGLAALSLAAAGGALAQDEMTPKPPVEQEAPMAPEPTKAQMAEMDSWPEERRVAYEAWPVEAQDYYWSLTPERQTLFWRLEDPDKVAIVAMSPDQQEKQWSAIERVAAGSNG